MDVQTNCPSCNDLIESDAEICPNCGQEFCPDCDHPLEPDATVCRGCGLEFGLYCFNCDEEVDAETTVCPHCNTMLESPQTSAAIEEEPKPGAEQAGSHSPAHCPNCRASDSLMNGFCTDCGQAFCGRCNHPVGEDDDECSNCGGSLYFSCPNCQFELTTGTELCPSCGVLFPRRCDRCRAGLSAGATHCPECQEPVSISRRTSARIIHTLMVKDQLIRIAACAECGSQFDLAGGVCRACGHRACPDCQTNLEPEELRCPRCGLEAAGIETPGEARGICSTCGKSVLAGSDECPHCQQTLCPQCGASVDEEEDTCPSCGAEFELICPKCQAIVTAEATACPECKLPF